MRAFQGLIIYLGLSILLLQALQDGDIRYVQSSSSLVLLSGYTFNILGGEISLGVGNPYTHIL